jgi:hypothetical protein
MRMRSYEPAEFVSVLASNQPLAAPMDLTVYGLVKADESDSSVLCFQSRIHASDGSLSPFL